MARIAKHHVHDVSCMLHAHTMEQIIPPLLFQGPFFIPYARQFVHYVQQPSSLYSLQKHKQEYC